MKIVERKYQNEIVEAIAHEDLARATLLCCPTGSGKTFMVGSALKKLGLRTVSISHRIEIRKQIDITFAALGVKNTSLSPSDKAFPEQLDVADCLFIDEAHHTPASSFRKCYEYAVSTEKKIIGASATPYRTDKVSVTDYYSRIVGLNEASKLSQLGYLAPLRYVRANNVDFKELKEKRRKEIDLDKAFQKIRTVIQVGEVAQAWKDHAEGTQALIFCIDQNHAELVYEELHTHSGLNVDIVTTRTSIDRRKKAIEDFESGKLNGIVNCSVFTEGVDLKNVGCIIMLRPTQSRGLYKQIIGRGMRPDVPCTVVDMVGNYNIHGDVLDEDPENIYIHAKNTTVASKQSAWSNVAGGYELDVVKIEADMSAEWLMPAVGRLAG